MRISLNICVVLLIWFGMLWIIQAYDLAYLLRADEFSILKGVVEK